MKNTLLMISMLSAFQVGCQQQQLQGTSHMASTGSVGASATVVAKIKIKDASGAPVSGATVTGTWSGVMIGQASAVSTADGYANIASPKSKLAGTYTFTVTNIAKSGYTYNPASNKLTQNSIVR